MTAFQDRLRQAVVRSGRKPRAISLAAGVSAGTVSELLRDPQRSPSVETLRAIARELGTSFMWLAEGSLPNDPPRGMRESAAEPWLPRPSGERPDLYRSPDDVISVVAPRARHGATWRCKTQAPLFGILPGDILVIDLKRTARDGEIVLANVADLNTGAASTVLRKLATPYLLSADPSDTAPPLVVDGARTVVLGPVVAVIRSADLAA